MLRIYFLTAWRNLKKNKMVSAINILGLTVGLACAVLAIIYSYHELTYEDCHVKADRICRVYLGGDFGELKWIPNTWGPEGEAIKNLFPEIEKTSISRNVEAIVRVGENIFIEKQVLFADSNFFSILTIPFIEGEPSTEPQTVVISKKTAIRYFGNGSAIGKAMLFTRKRTKFSMMVTGVFKDLPSNTEVQTDFIIPFSTAENQLEWKSHEYNGTDYTNMVLLKPGTDIKEMNKKIVTNYKIPVKIEGVKAYLMPLKRIHLNGDYNNNYGKFLVFLIGGILVLIISCINYINLTNILFSTRHNEIGTRMVNGARRGSIFKQLITDTVFSTSISFLLAIGILQIILPQFNALMDTQISLAPNWELMTIGFSLFAGTVLLSGVYPAIKVSTSDSIEFFRKAGTTFTTRNRSLWILTTIQFMIAVLFIQVILVMNKQNNHFADAQVMGFTADDVICMKGNIWGDLEKVKADLLKDPSIRAVSWANALPSAGMNITTDWKNKDNKVPANQLFTAEDYLQVYQIKMMAGHYFTKEFNGDFADGVVINQKTMAALGYKDPVGKQMDINGHPFRIIGVVGEYMSVPPIFNEMPQIIRPIGAKGEYLTILINPKERTIAHKHIKQTLQKFNPDYPIDIKYHVDVTSERAKSYYAASRLMNTFFFITILTALFGLFGLSVFIAERNRKEIGIRKVCGASIPEIISKLSRGLVWQLLIAICLATPITVFICGKYLSMFPKHIKLDFMLLGKGGLLALTLMLITVSWQSWRAASKDPVQSLRYE